MPDETTERRVSAALFCLFLSAVGGCAFFVFVGKLGKNHPLRKDLKALNIDLKDYGFGERFAREAALYEDLFAARVSEQHHDLYRVVASSGEIDARVSGRFAHTADDETCFPAVGDWVMIDRLDDRTGSAIIHHVLPRKSMLVRQSAGLRSSGQVISANIDTIFICMSLNEDFNVRRIERYLAIAWDSGATPVIVLTKADLCADLPYRLSELNEVSIGVDVITCSAAAGTGFDEIESHIEPGKTIAFVGSSGVGKSTIINRLMGRDVLDTQAVREDDGKGRHTTTHRQLLLLPQGGIVIDTPGMRELQIHSANLTKAFEDVEAIAAQCRFSDCSHRTEPGCAIRAAIADGTLSEERFASYNKLQREAVYAGLSSRQRENEKLTRMFGGKSAIKQFRKEIKTKKR